VRLDPEDEYTHRVGPEPTFQESMYFNVYDPAAGLGAFWRLGNRPNEGTGEMTACIYLPPDAPPELGRVAFMFRRPTVTSNDAMDAAGMRFTVVKPFEHLEVAYRGDVLLLDDPLTMVDPKTAFQGGRYAPCEAELVYAATSVPLGGEPDVSRERPGEEFARAHYEVLVEATGFVSVGDHGWEIHGYGLRDHSWGPRTWQAPWYYRWLTGNFGAEFGFMGSHVARRSGDGTRAGFVWDHGSMRLCELLSLDTEWEGDDHYHRRISAVLASGPDQWKITGRVMNLVPLRNRRPQPDGEVMVTRISEGLTEWTLESGPVTQGPVPEHGYGLSEYLDQIVDGVPVGLEASVT
jgi:hypothetical protein